jgi:hypothetical protein
MIIYVSAAEIAKRISMSENYIHDQAKKGLYKAHHFGPRAVRYDPQEVAKAIGFVWSDETLEPI